MKRKLYWAITTLIILLISFTTFIYLNTLSKKRQIDRDVAYVNQKVQERSKEATDRSIRNKPAEREVTQSPVDSQFKIAEKQSADALTYKTDPSDVDTDAENSPTSDVRVSPFGFGPYPELPVDFPHQDIFFPYPSHSKTNPNFELMRRVWVELWKRGEQVEGMGTRSSTGLFYPTIRGRIYVDWGPRWEVLGMDIGRRILYIDGHPDDLDAIREKRQEDHPLLESDIPSDIKILDSSEGIDPYTFLDLPRQ